MPEERLFRPALAGVLIQAGWRYPDGWHVWLSTRREGESWESSLGDRYERLGTAEALDVMAAQVDVLRAREGLEPRSPWAP